MKISGIDFMVLILLMIGLKKHDVDFWDLISSCFMYLGIKYLIFLLLQLLL